MYFFVFYPCVWCCLGMSVCVCMYVHFCVCMYVCSGMFCMWVYVSICVNVSVHIYSYMWRYTYIDTLFEPYLKFNRIERAIVHSYICVDMGHPSSCLTIFVKINNNCRQKEPLCIHTSVWTWDTHHHALPFLSRLTTIADSKNVCLITNVPLIRG